MDCYAVMYIIQNGSLLGQMDETYILGQWVIRVTKCDPAQHCYTSVRNETSIHNVVMNLVNM